MIQKTCIQCNNSYSTYQANIKNSKNTYCSSKCYGLWQRGKSFIEQKKPKTKPELKCKVEQCPKKHFGKSYCKTHYAINIELNSRPHICTICSKEYIAKFRPKYCSKECRSKGMLDKPFIIHTGYKKILLPNHHRADVKGYVFEHIIVMENKLGRLIKRPEVVHHIDHDGLNNHPDNLMLFATHSEHIKFHFEEKRNKN